MKVARVNIGGTVIVAVDDGTGFVDYTAILNRSGYASKGVECDPELIITNMITRGLLEESFVSDLLGKSRKSGKYQTLDIAELHPLLPLRPRKIVCMTRNYVKHATEQGHKMPEKPVFFVKTENCVIGHDDPIKIPTDLGRVDHEGELAVVIAKKSKRITHNDVDSHIFGYTIINDVTARGFQHKLAENRWPWYMAKAMDSFAPIGPWIVSKSDMGELSGKGVKVFVNEQLRQDGSFDDMYWSVADLIVDITKYITLQPGDMVATGTPEGIGSVVDGDRVSVEIDGIGRLSNPVIAI